MKHEASWLSIRGPAPDVVFELSDGRLVKEVGEVVRKYRVNPVIAGILTLLPDDDEWTAEERDRWLSVLRVVLDYAIPVKADPVALSTPHPTSDRPMATEAHD